MKTKRLLLILLAAGALAPAALSQTVIIRPLSEPMGIFSDLNPNVYPIDVDGDGVVDFTFGADPGAVGLRTERSNWVVVRLSPPPNIGGGAADLPAGFTVGPSLDEPLAWFSSDTHGGVFVLIVLCLNIGCASEWPSGPATHGYIGFQFEKADGLHYGYFDIELRGDIGGAVLFGWAYESRPDTPLLAGRLPSAFKFTANLTGTNEVPANHSLRSGLASFTLQGNTLTYEANAGGGIVPTTAGLYGPSNPDSISRRLLTNLAVYLTCLTNADGYFPINIPLWPYPVENLSPVVMTITNVSIFPPITWPQPYPPHFFISETSYRGAVTLTQKQIAELLAGRLYVNLNSAEYPRGEIRGQILSAAPIQFAASFSGADEIPRNRSRSHGVGTFTLTGNQLAYHLALDAGILPLTAGIYECPPPRARRAGLISALDISMGMLIPAGGISGEPGVVGQVLYRGEVNLNDQEVWQLKRGDLFADFFTSRYPRGEVSGQILPTDADQDGVPDYINGLLEQSYPCDGPWNSHVQYVAAVRDVAEQFVAARLITVPQFWQIVRAAQHSNCGPDH